MSDEQAELPSLDDVASAEDDLRQLHQLRGKISQQLGSIATKQQIRRKVVNHLYELFEIVAEDMDALARRLIQDDMAANELADGFDAMRFRIEEVLASMREKLMLPIRVTEEREVFEKIVGHEVYGMNAQARLAALKAAEETIFGG